MTHLKILTVLAGLAFLVACGGSATPADNNVDNMSDGDNTGGDNSGGDNSGGGNAGGGGNGGNATDCTATPFHADCNADAPAARLRESMCLADITTNPLCMGPTGIATLFCEADPFNTNAACMHNDFNDERTAIIDGCRTNNAGAGCADVAIPYACNADAFDTLCEKSYTIGYCFTGDNIANDERCGYDAEADPNASDPTDNALFTTRAALNCLGNPFAPACTDDLGADFAEVARVNRLAHCNDLDNFAEDTCFDATPADVCNDYDLFANICITEENSQTFQLARAHFCIGEGEGSDITDARCANAFPQLITRTAEAAAIANGCITNPFADGCGVYLGGSTAIAQTNRITFCTDEANPGNAALAVCAGYTPCAVSPFHPICQQYFETARNTRLELCKRADGVLPTDSACAPAQITGICDYDPFNEVCFTGALIAQYAPARAERLPFCELAENSDKTLCLEANYRKTINVTLGNWKAGIAALDPAIVVDAVADNESEFLLITPSGGVTADTLPSGLTSLRSINRILTLADFNLGGERADGVQYFVGIHPAGARSYAGILPDTDLGAPLTEATAMGTWDARIMSQLPNITFTQGRIDSEFQLEVDFNAGTIQAFLPIKATDGTTSFAATSGPARMIHLFIDGTFDKTAGATQGLISGEVTVAQFAGGVRGGAQSNPGTGILSANPNSKQEFKATLTGLIGQDGAVGTYLRHTSSLTGVFIACPPSGCGTPAPCTFAQNCVTHADWVTAASADAGRFVASASTAAQNDDLEQGTPLNQFISSGPLLGGGRQGYSQNFSANLDIGSTGVGARTEDLGGDVKDGFSLGLSGTDAGVPFYYYAAIDPTTHLGSPLLQTSGSATWRGWAIILAGYTTANHSARNTSRGFNLTLNFNSAGGTLDAFIPQGGVGTAHHLIEGQFNASGIISGRTPGQGVIQADFAGSVIDGARTNITPGRLSGIIGQEGAVAVFISDDKVTNTNNFAGGFVARPVKPVDYNAWVAKVTPPITPTIDPARKHEFLKINDPSLAPTDAHVFVLRMATNTDNGMGFFEEASYGYAGIFTSTDVGAPIPVTPAFIGQDVTASWPAKMRAYRIFTGINFGDGASNTGELAFNLIVNFTQRTLRGRRNDPAVSQRRIEIFGSFLSADNGVITGTVQSLLHLSGSHTRIGHLTGLIGAEGAVAAFIYKSGGQDGNFAGGFVAAPGLPPQTAAKDAVVTYGDWLEIAAPDAALNATTPQNQFLQAIPPVFDLSGVDVGTVTNLNFGIFPGDVNNGVLFLQGAHVANGDTFSYAGILPNTNLGAPLGIPAPDAPQSAEWNGRIQTIGYALTAVTDGPDFKPFTLEVNFANRQIEAFVQTGVAADRNGANRDTHYFIRGQYNDRGVISARNGVPGIVHGRFTGGRNGPHATDPRTVRGNLTGLIGTAGAVGAFYSTERSTAPDAATAGDSYVGGFVARPN